MARPEAQRIPILEALAATWGARRHRRAVRIRPDAVMNVARSTAWAAGLTRQAARLPHGRLNLDRPVQLMLTVAAVRTNAPLLSVTALDRLGWHRCFAPGAVLARRCPKHLDG